MKLLHIFKAGTHRSMSGQELTFSEADVAAAAGAYDPAVHEAPLVVGHPKHNEPAFGHVQSMSASGGDLFAIPDQVNPDFAELVRSGAYKKISAAFYSPDASTNPVPGVWYLRHVGFLGAQPPAIKGLKPIEFGDDEAGVVTLEFAEEDFAEPRRLAGLIARMARSIREWVIESQGIEKADQAMPAWIVDQAIREEQDDDSRAFSEADDKHSKQPTEVMDQKDKKKAEETAAEFAEKEQEIEGREAKVAEREAKLAKQEEERTRARHAEFVESLVKDGARVLPVHQDTVIEALLQLGGSDVKVEFGEGDAAAEKPIVEAFTEFLKGLPKNVEFAEVSKGRGDRTDGEDPEAQARRIGEYRDEQLEKGRTISFAEAQAELKKNAA